jgi:hypothetical protein
MKVWEIISENLNEAISLADKREDVKVAIVDGIQNWTSDLADKLPEQQNPTEYSQSYSRLLHYFISHSLFKLSEQLSQEPSFPKDAKFNRRPSVDFRQLGSANGGVNDRGDIDLNEKLLDPIVHSLKTHLVQFTTVDDMIKFLRNFKPMSHEEKQAITNISHTFIHEFVHVYQMYSQDRWNKEPEVRSYLLKGDKRKRGSNKRKFEELMRGKLNDKSMQYYLSSPQEIPAHAHNFALEIIEAATFGEDPFQYDDPYDINMSIDALDTLLKDSQLWSQFTRAEQYKQFNQPGTELYKIYKRFLKTTYQEIMSYRNKLVQYMQTLQGNQS